MSLGLLAGCERTPDVPELPVWIEDALPPIRPLRLQVGPIEQNMNEDRSIVYLAGTVRNLGNRATRRVTVTVTASDAQDQVVAQAEDVPDPVEIPPGGEARYIVQFPNDPTIKGFHVEAVGR